MSHFVFWPDDMIGPEQQELIERVRQTVEGMGHVIEGKLDYGTGGGPGDDGWYDTRRVHATCACCNTIWDFTWWMSDRDVDWGPVSVYAIDLGDR